jgi:phosphinothricin acetyltransferase
METTIRPAAEADIPAIAAITNEAIVSTTAHFATTPDEPGEVLEWFRRDRDRYPWLVAQSEAGDAVGFARAAQWKTREAYDWTCESGVYLAPPARGRGLGRALYQRLFSEIEDRGFRCVLAGVTIPNPPSERLHESLGMRAVGEFPSVGFKHGRWLAVRYYCLNFGGGEPPATIGSGPAGDA